MESTDDDLDVPGVASAGTRVVDGDVEVGVGGVAGVE